MIPKLLKKKKKGRPRKDEQNSQTQAQQTKTKQNDSIKMNIIKLLTNNYEQEIATGVRHLLNLDDAYNLNSLLDVIKEAKMRE